MAENRQREEAGVRGSSVEAAVVMLGLRWALWVMKGKSENRVWVEKGLFEWRKAEKQRSRDEDRVALESGQKSREQLWRENALFTGMKVRIDLDRAKALS